MPSGYPLIVNGEGDILPVVTQADVDIRSLSFYEDPGGSVAMSRFITANVDIIRGGLYNRRQMMDRRPAHGCGRIKGTIPSLLQNMDRSRRRIAAITASHGGDTVNAAR